jgi:hypothetical protein
MIAKSAQQMGQCPSLFLSLSPLACVRVSLRVKVADVTLRKHVGPLEVCIKEYRYNLMYRLPQN